MKQNDTSNLGVTVTIYSRLVAEGWLNGVITVDSARSVCSDLAEIADTAGEALLDVQQDQPVDRQGVKRVS